jgi:hypothetical protein
MDGVLYTTLLVNRYSTTPALLDVKPSGFSYEVDDPKEIFRQIFMI